MTSRKDTDRADTPDSGGVSPGWFEEAFGELYPLVYAHRTAEAAEPEAAFAREQTGLASGMRALDLCCGTGRHLGHLLRYAPEAVGLDYSPHLLRLARTALGPSVPLVRGDIRALPFDSVFDAVFNFFTSFGYFLGSDDDCRAANEIARILKPGGAFYMDFMNVEHDLPLLVPFSERKHGLWVFVERRWHDPATSRINKTIEVQREGIVVKRFTESVRAYTCEELDALFGNAGLVLHQTYGSVDGQVQNTESPRMILIFEKKVSK